MRRLLFLGSILLLSFGLAGCDLIPTDIIDQVSEYNGVAEEVIDEKIQTFIKDLEDPEKSNDEICSTWFDGVDDDCNQLMEENRAKFKTGAELSKTVNILDPDSDDDGLVDATISFDYNGHVTVLKISFDLDSTTSDLQLKIVDSEVTFTPNSETVAQLDAFIGDLTNSALSDDEICSVWYDGVDDDCDKFMEENRAKFKAGAELSKTVDFLDPDSDDDGLLEATICCFDYNGQDMILKISFDLDNTTGDLQLKIVDSEVTFTPNNETTAQLDAFIDDLMNLELSNSEVCSIWYDGIDDDCDGPIELARTKFKAGAELSKTVNIYDPDSDGDGLGDLVLSLNDDGTNTVLKISFTEDYSSEELNLTITAIELIGGGDCDDEGCPVRPDDALTFYQEYLDEYLDASVSIETLKSYFETTPSEEYFALREKYLQEGANIVLIDVVGPVAEETYIFVYDIVNGDEASRKDEKVRVSKHIDAASPYLALSLIGGDHDDDDDGILTSEEIDTLASFKDDLNDENILIEDICVKYFGKDDDSCCPTCRPLRDTEEGYIISDIELLEFDDSKFIRIRKRPGRTTYESQEIISTHMIFFYRDEAGSVIFDLVPTKYFDYENELTKGFDQLLTDLDDTTIPLDEVCLAVSTESYSQCNMLRRVIAGNNPSISKTETVTVDGISMYKITIQYSAQDELIEMMFYVSFVRDPESMHQVLEIINVE